MASKEPTAAISMRGVSKSYDGRPVLHELDLEVKRGEVYALLGPNGAGKTTTVEILEGLRRPDSGQVSVLGDIPWGAHASWRDRIGVVLQESSDASDLSVYEAVAHHRIYYSRPRAVDDVLASVGLAEASRSRVGVLSGGQRRRLDVALALVGSPDLVFLDEPTTGFDPAARRDFWSLVLEMRDQGTTVLLTTHYMEEAERLSDRVGVLLRGRLIAQGTTHELGERFGRESAVSWTDGDGAHSVRTPQPEQLVAALQSRGRQVTGLTITRPTLEDVYLSLIETKVSP
ncbi:MAG: ABC transporter ATP-binding protein [Nakamurella sp.]